jgi:hypothetical protein
MIEQLKPECELRCSGRVRISWSTSDTSRETECHDITEVLLKVALNTIKQAQLCYFSANHDILIQNHDILIHLWFYEREIPVFVLVCCFCGVRVTRSLVLYVCFVDRCLIFCTCSFDHCVVCSSSIYGLWLSLWS